MRKSVVVLTALAVAATALSGAARAEDKVVRIGTEAAYAPFEYKDEKGELKGMEIELGNAMCAAMKVKCQFINMDFDSLIPALGAKKIDAALSQMSITDERKKTVDFTKLLTIAPVQYVAKKGSGITDDPATLKGKTLGVQSGTTHEAYANAKLKDVVTLKVYQGLDDAWLDLKSGRVDVVLADATVDFDWLQKEGSKAGFDYAGKQINDVAIFGEGTGIALRKGDTALRDAFNKAIDTIVADGTFKKINDKYFPFSIAGQ